MSLRVLPGRTVLLGIFVVLLSCKSNEAPARAECAFTGTWQLDGAEAERTCAAETTLQRATLRISDHGDTYGFELRTEDADTLECSGIVDESSCGLAVTCRGTTSNGELRSRIELELSEENALRGVEKVRLLDSNCEIAFETRARRIG